ncbi:L,D-transpeptidase family protein [Terrisporobacter glycolicus]|uniref:L,D-transpeptidase family protein n=1 Tax=Terrisporobacter glycolicus TaxID=36841 RepID=UPI000A8EB416
MKKRFKSFCTILLATVMILASSIPIANAATNQLIIVNSKKNTLNFYENYTLVRKFKCATGKSSTPTPQRKTTIVNKIKNRPYYKGNIPGGDPRNPLGKRWMGLNMYGYGTTYGIHGNNKESSIGKNVSGGCIRMHNKDVEWLYNKIRVGATVIIKSTSKDDAWIANQYGIKLRNIWYTNSGYKYYRKSNGKYATGWYTIDNKTYYFDSKGRMQTGLKTISGKKYYLGKDGIRQIGWQTISGKKYYFEKSGNAKGQAVKDKRSIDGSYYYFDKNCVMIANKKIKIGNADYYFGKDGKMQTGWQTISGKKYYFKKSGDMKGQALKGKKSVNGTYYYFDDNCAMVIDKKIKIGNDYYYFGSNGKMVKNKEIKIKSDSYYFGGDGKAYKSCEKQIDGYTYTFDKVGKIINKTEIEKDTSTSKKAYDSKKTDESQPEEIKENNEDTSSEEAM